ncbi:hypothetical protein ACF5W4_18155 [Bacillota bacterium Lsc_1132]
MEKDHEDVKISQGKELSEAEEANLEMQKPFKGETEQTPKQGVSSAFIYNPVVNTKKE